MARPAPSVEGDHWHRKSGGQQWRQKGELLPNWQNLASPRRPGVGQRRIAVQKRQPDDPRHSRRHTQHARQQRHPAFSALHQGIDRPAKQREQEAEGAGHHIWVYSEAGHGTTFKVYLPRVDDAAEDPVASAGDVPMPQGTETVLLIEDEPLVRELTSTILQAQGYTVLVASNGEEALRLMEATGGEAIDLLVTDVVMPQMGGKMLAEQVTSRYPHIKVLFISGYSTDAIVHRGRLEPGTHFLSKPFTRTAFARKVREVLDS